MNIKKMRRITCQDSDYYICELAHEDLAWRIDCLNRKGHKLKKGVHRTNFFISSGVRVKANFICIILITACLSFLSFSNHANGLNSTKSPAVLNAPPEKPDQNRFYLIYIHGKIAEGSDGNPISSDYGPYEYFNIVNDFAQAGFVTISEIREKNTDIERYSIKMTQWIESLLKAGIPPQHITVVGASKGGMIAAKVADRLKNKEIKYVFLAGLFKEFLDKEHVKLWGEILSVYDTSDKSQGLPEAYLKSSPKITKFKILVTETGLSHGLIFKPYPVWMKEIVSWSGIKN